MAYEVFVKKPRNAFWSLSLNFGKGKINLNKTVVDLIKPATLIEFLWDKEAGMAAFRLALPTIPGIETAHRIVYNKLGDVRVGIVACKDFMVTIGMDGAGPVQVFWDSETKIISWKIPPKKEEI